MDRLPPPLPLQRKHGRPLPRRHNRAARHVRRLIAYTTTKDMTNLGGCLSALGAHEEARRQCEDIVRRSRLALGPDDPRTLRAASNLAVFLRRLDDHQAALAVWEDTLLRYRRVLGEDHPDTLHAKRDLVALLRAMGEHDRAHAVAGEPPAGS
ncbi:tetratricopeptide repeat protein [Streptomyces anthocyanicus]|uniref:tetratricopeptide repeat protein n=1 Tax=Streptomyces anthocyanicus TaxID=68174 RepID=UPI00386C616D